MYNTACQEDKTVKQQKSWTMQTRIVRRVGLSSPSGLSQSEKMWLSNIGYLYIN